MFEELTNPYTQSIKTSIENCGNSIAFLHTCASLPQLLLLGEQKICTDDVKFFSFTLNEAGLETKTAAYLACANIDMLAAIEGIDPLQIICTDLYSCKKIFETYNAQVPKDQFARGVCIIFGRRTLLFSNLKQSYIADRPKTLEKLINWASSPQ